MYCYCNSLQDKWGCPFWLWASLPTNTYAVQPLIIRTRVPKWKSSCPWSNEDVFVRLEIPALVSRGEVFRHVLSTSRLHGHVKWSTSGVSARLRLMCTHQAELPLMLSQEHHNLCWPWTLFHAPFMGTRRSFWLALCLFAPCGVTLTHSLLPLQRST